MASIAAEETRVNMRVRVIMSIALVAGLGLMEACNFPFPASPPELTQTAVAAMLSARQTQASLATATLAPTDTPVPPTSTSTTTPTPEPTATPACQDSSQFVLDVTIPDNSSMKPGQGFTKTWRLRNDGTCDWTTEYEVVRVDGASMGGPASVALSNAVYPDGTVDISVDLTAPTANGVHRTNYQLRNADGGLFGVVFYVQVVVGPTPTPASSIYRSGRLTIDNGASVDFDNATSAGDPRRDVWLHAVSDSERYLDPENGARLKKMSGAPSQDQCEEASLKGDPVSFSDFDTGTYFCYKTSEGRYGRFEVAKIEADSITFDFRTWK
jgi:Ig-like domain from next to BRCA1 gene